MLTAEHLFACCIVLRLHKMGDRKVHPLIRTLVLLPSIHALQSMDRTVRRVREKMGLRARAGEHSTLEAERSTVTAAVSGASSTWRSEQWEPDAHRVRTALRTTESATQTGARSELEKQDPETSSDDKASPDPLAIRAVVVGRANADTTGGANEQATLEQLQLLISRDAPTDQPTTAIGSSIEQHECGIEVREIPAPLENVRVQ